MTKQRVRALVLAAGRGERLGHASSKGFVPIAGRPLLAHAIEAIRAAAVIERIVPVIPASEAERYDSVTAALSEATRARSFATLSPPIFWRKGVSSQPPTPQANPAFGASSVGERSSRP